jgi:hypothetical protein
LALVRFKGSVSIYVRPIVVFEDFASCIYGHSSWADTFDSKSELCCIRLEDTVGRTFSRIYVWTTHDLIAWLDPSILATSLITKPSIHPTHYISVGHAGVSIKWALVCFALQEVWVAFWRIRSHTDFDEINSVATVASSIWSCTSRNTIVSWKFSIAALPVSNASRVKLAFLFYNVPKVLLQ